MSFHIRELNRATWYDLVKLFEKTRLTSQCYCLSHRVAPQDLVIEKEAHDTMRDWVCPAPKLRSLRPGDEATTGDGAKPPVSETRVHGLLLYDEATAVGWISIDPLASLVGHDAHVDAREGEWTIHCVFLLPEYRKQAHSQTLIRAALEMARSRGATVVTAFPCPSESEAGQPESILFGGRMNSFLELGFVRGERLSDLYHRMEFRFS